MFDDFKHNAETKNIEFEVIGLERSRKKNTVKKFREVVQDHRRTDQQVISYDKEKEDDSKR